MSDELTREQLHAELSKVLLNVQPFDAILAHDAAQRATIEAAHTSLDEIARACGHTDGEQVSKVSFILATMARLEADKTELYARLDMERLKKEAVQRDVERLEASLTAVTAEARDAVDAAKEEAAGLRMRLAAVTEKLERLQAFVNKAECMKALLQAEQERDAALAMVRDHQAAVEMIASSRDVLLNTFCQWQVEYGKGKMALRQLPHVEQQRDEALAKVQEMESEVWKAHVPVTGTQHDPTRGLLHGYCERCRDVWPCQYAPERNAQFQAEQRVAQLEGAARKVWETIPATYGGTAEETHARALVELNALVQQALQPPAPRKETDHE